MSGALDVFTAPRNVVVVGASNDSTSWGFWLARGALLGSDRRPVYLVNSRGGQVQGRLVHGSISDLPQEPDLVVLAVPASSIDEVVSEALARGARGFLGITADVSGTGDPTLRAKAERDLAARIIAGGARLIGPNCLGLFDATAGLSLAWGDFASGRLGLVSQSGQVGLEIGELAKRFGIGFSRFISVGSQADVGIAEALRDLADDPGTRVAALYMEDLGDARELVAAALVLRERGIPVLLLHPGTSVAGARAAASHTAALAGSTEVIDSVARAAGMSRVFTPAALVGAAAVLLAPTAPVVASTRTFPTGVAVVSDSGGQGVIAADLLESVGIAVPLLDPSTQAVLHRFIPLHAGVANPVDLAGSGEADLANYARAVVAVAADPATSTVLLTGYFGKYGVDSQELSAREGEVADALVAVAAGCSVLIHSMAATGPTAARLRRAGLPVFDTIEQATSALAGALCEPPDPPAFLTPRSEPADRSAAPSSEPLGGASNYAQVRALLVGRGVRFPAALTVVPTHPGSDRAAVIAAARAIGGLVVLKATAFEHKTDVGGVILGLTADDVGGAFDRLTDQFGAIELTVEEQFSYPSGAVELLVGGRIDRNAGPLLVVASGGIFAEYLLDSTAALAPVSRVQADRLLDRLRSSRLLKGWRGALPADRAALVDVVIAVSDVLVGNDSEWTELEMNPVLAWSGGAIALDAWGVRASNAQASGRLG